MKKNKQTCLRSSLYHSKSALGTAEASHCKTPFCPSEVPVLLAFEMNGGSTSQSKTNVTTALLELCYYLVLK